MPSVPSRSPTSTPTTPTSSQARWGIATDSQGRVYISAAYQFYILSPTTGAQLGYFTLPNNDTLQVFPETAGANFYNNEQNYAFALNPQDELWIVDPNTAIPGSYTLYHTNSSGGLLDYGSMAVTPVGTTAVATFAGLAVDSAGSVYITVTYATGLDQPVIQRVQLLHGVVSVVSTLTYPLPTPYLLPTSTRISISWGATSRAGRLLRHQRQLRLHRVPGRVRARLHWRCALLLQPVAWLRQLGCGCV